MSLLFTVFTNHEFQSRDDGAEYDRPESALAGAVQAAVLLIAEKINAGEPNAAIEVSVERADSVQLLRAVVAISVSPLLPLDSNALPHATPPDHFGQAAEADARVDPT